MKKFAKIALPVTVGLAGILLARALSVDIPKGAVAVKDFDAKKYLGKWFEIARFDYRFEKNLINVTATYSEKPNGNIEVLNRGFHPLKNKWQEAKGEVKFVNTPDEGRLKVSFFKPIWAGYNIIDIDEDYKYALVVGDNLDYIWFLSREKKMPEHIRKRFMEKAESLGYDLTRLVWVKQN